MRDLDKENLSVLLSRKTQEEAIEVLRSALVSAMRIGDTFVLNCGKTTPCFHKVWTDSEELPMETICDFNLWRKSKNNKRILKKNEDHDMLGNKKQFRLNDSFTVVFLFNYHSDD